MGHMVNGMIFSLKNEENSGNAATWMNLDDIMLNEIRQSQKVKYYMIPVI